MKSQIVVLFVIISVAAISAQNSQVYCGRRLARTLAAYCSQEFNPEDKRSNEIDTYSYEGSYNLPWLPKSEALGLMGRSKRQGIVTECCDKPCTVEEMLTYC